MCNGTGISVTGNPCQGCGGTGQTYHLCSVCDGTGEIETHEDTLIVAGENSSDNGCSNDDDCQDGQTLINYSNDDDDNDNDDDSNDDDDNDGNADDEKENP